MPKFTIANITNQLNYNLFQGPTYSRILEKKSLTKEQYWKERYYQLGIRLNARFEQYLQPLIASPTNIIRVCSIGCGFAEEISALIVFLNKHGKKLHYVGLDSDQARLDMTKHVYSSFAIENNSTLEFINIDACQYQTIDDDNNKFDLIILRHPVLFQNKFSPNENQNFINIIKKTLPAILKNDGMAFVTFYKNEERLEFEKLIDKTSNKMQIITNSAIKNEECFKTIMIDSETQYHYDAYLMVTKGFAPRIGLSLFSKCLFFTIPIVAAATAATVTYLHSSSDLRPR